MSLLPILLTTLTACDRGFADPSRVYGDPVPEGLASPAPAYPVTIARPTTLGAVDTPLTDVHGTPIGVSCDTCHEPSSGWASRPGPAFHTGVQLQHGAISCDSCHDPADRRQLRLADGRPVALQDALELCAQCHGPQTRDYRHGSHGGMAGYWDTRRGPRDRTHCVSCHAPHTPAYAQVLPVFPPNDRRPLEHE